MLLISLILHLNHVGKGTDIPDFVFVEVESLILKMVELATSADKKTMDFVASCKNQREEKPCRNKYCLRCLLNRYQEKAEEAAGLNDWKCPKCRGICDCSLCMRKRGQQPIRIRAHAAKTARLQSALEMSTVNDPAQQTKRGQPPIHIRAHAAKRARLQSALEMSAVNDPRNSSRAVNHKKTSSTNENIVIAYGCQEVGTSNFKKAHLRCEVNVRVGVEEEEKTESVGGSARNTARVRLKNLARAKNIMPEKSNTSGSLLERRKDDAARQPVESPRIAKTGKQDKSRNSNKLTPLTIKTVTNRTDVLSVLLSQNRIGYR